MVLLVLCVAPAAEAGAGWSGAGQLATARSSHTATLLADGRVLVAGGRGSGGDVASAERYDPAANEWSPASAMATPRRNHTATLLPSGKVLVTGGQGAGGHLESTELYDPATNTWSAAAPMGTARTTHTATLLPSGKLLVAGGENGSGPLASAELYDPATNTWSPGDDMAGVRSGHTATALPGGRVLVVGGLGSPGCVTRVELYDPASGAWFDARAVSYGRIEHAATLLTDGRVLVAGGIRPCGGDPSDAAVYDPASDTWSSTTPMTTPRMRLAATLLSSGKVLVTGGASSLSPPAYLASAEAYDPGKRTWSSAEVMAVERGLHTTTTLANGKVLVTGGESSPAAYIAIAELYTPPTRVAATSVDFGDQVVGAASPVREMAVANGGDSNLFVTAAALGGPDADNYTVASDGCTGRSVAPGDVCLVGLRFTPETAGRSHPATLTLADNSAEGHTTVALNGHGVPPGAPAGASRVRLSMSSPRQKLGSAIKRGLRLRLKADRPGTAKVTVKLTPRLAKKLGLRRAAGTKSVRLADADKALTAVVPLRGLSRGARRRLARRAQAGFTVYFVHTAAGGSTARLERRITLKR